MSFRFSQQDKIGALTQPLGKWAAGMAFVLGSAAHAQPVAGGPPPVLQQVAADAARLPPEMQLLVRQALERHPEVLMSEAQSQAAYSAAKEARSQLGPSISVGSAAGLQHQSLGQSGLHNNYQQAHAYVRLSMPLFDPALRAQLAQREQNAVGSDWRWVDRREGLMLQVIDAYLELQKSIRLLAISQSNLKMRRDYLDLMKTIARSDLGRSSDISAAAARVALAEAVNINRLGQLEKSRLDFQLLVGGVSIDVRPELPKIVPAQSLEQAYQLALKNSPTIQVAQAELAVARHGIALAKAPYQPKVTLDATLKHGRDWGGVKGTQSDVYVGVQAEWRVWSSGGETSANKAAVANEAATRFAFDKVRDDLQRQVSVFWFDFMSGHEVTKAYGQYTENARAATEATRQQFRVGRKSLLDVLNSENELFTARSNLVTAEQDFVRATYRLLSVQGQLPAVLGL